MDKNKQKRLFVMSLIAATLLLVLSIWDAIEGNFGIQFYGGIVAFIALLYNAYDLNKKIKREE